MSKGYTEYYTWAVNKEIFKRKTYTYYQKGKTYSTTRSRYWLWSDGRWTTAYMGPRKTYLRGLEKIPKLSVLLICGAEAVKE